MTPLVTVLLCVHDGMPHLPAAVESILAQTWRDFELLVLDDASDDGTSSYLRSLSDGRVRVHRLPENRGLTAALNIGLGLARGEYIARQDADDLSHPQRLALQVAFLRAAPPVAAVGAQGRIIAEDGAPLEKRDLPLRYSSIRFAHLFDNALLHSAVMFRKAAVLAAGGYDEAYPVSQDYELWSRLSERHALANLPQRLVSLRQRANSITRTHRRPELVAAIQVAHFRRVFPGHELDPRQLALLSRFRTALPSEEIAPFHDLLHELLQRFRQSESDARHSMDFSRTAALLYARLGYNLLAEHKADALRDLSRGLLWWPPLALRLPWLRIAALLVLGDRARAWYEKLRRRSGKVSPSETRA